jgi:YVTN family beta-propeller protein
VAALARALYSRRGLEDHGMSEHTQKRLLSWLAMATAVWLCACSRPEKQPTPVPAAAAVEAPAAPRELLYVSAEQAGEVIVVDPATAEVVQRIGVGKRPRGLMASPDGKLLYVTKTGSPRAGPGVDESKLPPADRTADGIGVIELASGKLVRTLPGGQDPESVAVSPDGKALYIANEETAELSTLDLAKGAITQSIKVGQQPEGVSAHPDGKRVYVTCEEDNKVVAVDLSTSEIIAHIPVGKRPRALAWTADGLFGFVTNELDASVSVIDTRTQKVATVIPLSNAEQRPMGIVRSSDGKKFYVSTGRGGAIAELDAAEPKLVRTIEKVGARPWGIASSPDGQRLYTANGPSNDITVLDLASGATKHIELGGSPWGVVSVLR